MCESGEIASNCLLPHSACENDSNHHCADAIGLETLTLIFPKFGMNDN